MTDFRKDMRVTSVSKKYPGNGVVLKVNPRTILVRLDSGQEVRFDRLFLVPEGERPSDLQAAVVGVGAGAQVDSVPFVPAPNPGQFVRVKAHVVAREPRLAGLWVVGGGQGDKSRLFRVNNTDGRYWRIPDRDLEVVTVSVTEVQ